MIDRTRVWCVHKALMWEWQKHRYGREQRLQKNKNREGRELSNAAQQFLTDGLGNELPRHEFPRVLHTYMSAPFSYINIFKRYLYDELSHSSQRL